MIITAVVTFEYTGESITANDEAFRIVTDNLCDASHDACDFFEQVVEEEGWVGEKLTELNVEVSG